jgi:hypothetical protein
MNDNIQNYNSCNLSYFSSVGYPIRLDIYLQYCNRSYDINKRVNIDFIYIYTMCYIRQV